MSWALDRSRLAGRDRLTFSDAVAGEVLKSAHAASLAGIAEIAGDTYVGVAVSSGEHTTPLYALCEVRLPERLGDNTEGSHIPDASPA